MPDSLEDLERLLTLIAHGDKQAMADFFDATYLTVESWLSPSVAANIRDRILLDAFLLVWAEAPRYPASSSDVWSWLVTVTAPALAKRESPEPEAA